MTTPEMVEITRRIRAMHRRTLAAARAAQAARGLRQRALEMHRRSVVLRPVPVPPVRAVPVPVAAVADSSWAANAVRLAAFAAAASVAAQAAREWVDAADLGERDLAQAHADRADAHWQAWQERLVEHGVAAAALARDTEASADLGIDDPSSATIGYGLDIDAIAESTLDAVAAYTEPEPSVTELVDAASGGGAPVAGGAIAEPPEAVRGLDHGVEIGAATAVGAER